MEKIDLHIHTNLSDGDLDINFIIKEAKKNNCNRIAITDHELINDYSNYMVNGDIEIINGIEFNTSEKGMHILAYGIKNMEPIKKIIYDLHKENEEVTFKLIDKLSNKGFHISKEEVINFLIDGGYKFDFLDKRHIVKYLIANGLTKDVPSTYQNLIGRGTDLYLPLKKIEPKVILDLVNKCGGVSVLAHPETLRISSEKDMLLKVKQLVIYGLDGIEVFNSNVTNDNFQFYKELARRLDIISTLGSDFHSLNKQKLGVECDEDIYEKLKDKIICKK